MTYDSGDFPGAMDAALARAGYRDFAARQRAARGAGRHVGIGVANYVEGTGRGPFESAVVRVKPSGRVAVMTGATDQGQGLATSLAQVCAAELGVDLEDIDVVAGDTEPVALGLGRVREPPGGDRRLLGPRRRGRGPRPGAQGGVASSRGGRGGSRTCRRADLGPRRRGALRRPRRRRPRRPGHAGLLAARRGPSPAWRPRPISRPRP